MARLLNEKQCKAYEHFSSLETNPWGLNDWGDAWNATFMHLRTVGCTRYEAKYVMFNYFDGLMPDEVKEYRKHPGFIKGDEAVVDKSHPLYDKYLDAIEDGFLCGIYLPTERLLVCMP